MNNECSPSSLSSPDPSEGPEVSGAGCCPRCGLSRHELYTEGRMGCNRCYETFAEEVTRALREIHGEDQHIGKP